MARPSDRHSHLEVGKLIDGIDPKDVRPIIERLQALPHERDKSLYIAMLYGRWAEGDPQAALVYAQDPASGSVSDRKIAVSSIIRAWAGKDATAAQTWVMQMPPGQDRDRAMQSVVSSLAETDPQAALNMLQSLPATGASRQNYYWPIFSRWASTDPLTAAAHAAALPPGSAHDNALQVVASTWANQDPEAAFNWSNTLPPGQGRNNALQSILSNWASKDPERVSTIAATLPAGSAARPGNS